MNGVAERAIRTIFSHVRADLVASGAPKSFWIFAALQAIDTIQRTCSPPKSDLSSYELVTGDKPRVMGISTWGCQAFAVKQTQERRKTTLDSAAHTGMLLGGNPDQPGAFFLWLPEHKKKHLRLRRLRTGDVHGMAVTGRPLRRPSSAAPRRR